MLKTNKNITLIGYSVVNESNVEGYQAVIKSENPYDMNVTKWGINEDLYKVNLVQCRKDYEDFQKMANNLQDELIAQMD